MVSFQCLFFYTILFILNFFNGFSEQENSRIHRVYHRKNQIIPTIYVDKSGHGNYSTIQAAIDSIPPYNQDWICIYITAGTYRVFTEKATNLPSQERCIYHNLQTPLIRLHEEQVRIPIEKPYIYLKGEGRRKTNVTWDDYGSIDTDATFFSEADYTLVKSITFINSYNIPPKGSNNNMSQALAAKISGDKSTFYRCGFIGVQDTLWDVQGRHYFKLCTIVGAIDFIFGNGQSIYERCALVVNAGKLDGPGSITAQGRQIPHDQSGFVFKNCEVYGTGLTYLGRPWREYARVLFYRCSMSNVIASPGWSVWNLSGKENQLTFSEEKCNGIGSNTTQRVPWVTKLSQQELQQLTSLSFIDNEGWIMKQPLKVL